MAWFHSLSWVLLLFQLLSFVTIWVLELSHSWSFWVWSQFELLCLSLFGFVSLVTNWVFEFSHNLGLVTVWVLDLSYFPCEFCHSLIVWFVTFWVYRLSQFSFVTVCERNKKKVFKSFFLKDFFLWIKTNGKQKFWLK